MYTSSVIQNELIDLIGTLVQESIVDRINSSQAGACFSILVDETTDINHGTAKSVCPPGNLTSVAFEGLDVALQDPEDTEAAVQHEQWELAYQVAMDEPPLPAAVVEDDPLPGGATAAAPSTPELGVEREALAFVAVLQLSHPIPQAEQARTFFPKMVAMQDKIHRCRSTLPTLMTRSRSPMPNPAVRGVPLRLCAEQIHRCRSTLPTLMTRSRSPMPNPAVRGVPLRLCAEQIHRCRSTLPTLMTRSRSPMPNPAVREVPLRLCAEQEEAKRVDMVADALNTIREVTTILKTTKRRKLFEEHAMESEGDECAGAASPRRPGIDCGEVRKGTEVLLETLAKRRETGFDDVWKSCEDLISKLDVDIDPPRQRSL
ncbi:hypothetical protein FJT64_020305 [Amphibalanus amphitrite]|uniref:DUF4371 domain-containing protein n=1 Tax=Amphibalanus amphitrite TaxID=1232801 RepID=A0A6A4WT86_AMPAM|nr:hypothetical protein FJT64_020305 [Amphibalanus amphitrite]